MCSFLWSGGEAWRQLVEQEVEVQNNDDGSKVEAKMVMYGKERGLLTRNQAGPQGEQDNWGGARR